MSKKLGSGGGWGGSQGTGSRGSRVGKHNGKGCRRPMVAAVVIVLAVAAVCTVGLLAGCTPNVVPSRPGPLPSTSLPPVSPSPSSSLAASIGVTHARR